MTQPIKVYVDGGSHGNGKVEADAYGSFKVEGQEPIRLDYGHATNNVAEYRTLIAALTYCVEHSIVGVQFITDSQLMVHQINGTWKVNKPHLMQYVVIARTKLKAVQGTLKWVGRDTLVRELGH